jgi:hypothetical protein
MLYIYIYMLYILTIITFCGTKIKPGDTNHVDMLEESIKRYSFSLWDVNLITDNRNPYGSCIDIAVADKIHCHMGLILVFAISAITVSFLIVCCIQAHLITIFIGMVGSFWIFYNTIFKIVPVFAELHN